MKYIKRILIILFLVIMISGCKVNYNLKINKDLSVNEKVKVSENTNRMKSRTNLDVNQSVKYLYDIYKLEHMKDDDYSVVSSSGNTNVVINNSYKSIKDYSEKIHADIFDKSINYNDKGDISILFEQIELINTKATNRYVYDEIEITIEVPFEVIDNNADYVKGNKYTWIVKANADNYKLVYIEFNGNKYNDSLSFNFGKNSINIQYSIIAILVIILVALIGLIVIYIKNKKNNKM